jgi:ribonuclease BN (tRNA processing enzyme)
MIMRISHFHLDHCGALPYMSEMVGYEGPIYMTHPTKAICPILLVWFMLYVSDSVYICTHAGYLNIMLLTNVLRFESGKVSSLINDCC